MNTREIFRMKQNGTCSYRLRWAPTYKVCDTSEMICDRCVEKKWLAAQLYPVRCSGFGRIRI